MAALPGLWRNFAAFWGCKMENAQSPEKAELSAATTANISGNPHLKAIRLRYPDPENLPAIPLALMLLGREVSTPAMTYSKLHATRLPAYIGKLREMGLGEAILARSLPLTPQQQRRKHNKPFSAYHLPASVIEQLGEYGQQWALEVLRLHDVDIAVFPLPPADVIDTEELT